MNATSGPGEDDPLSAPEAIERRRSTRRFDPDRALPARLLTRILRLATHAPSEFNLQPWRFLVVRSARNRKRLRACAFGQGRITEASAVVIVLGYHHPDRTDLGAILAQQLERGSLTPEGAAEVHARAIRTLDREADPAPRAIRSSLLAAATLMIAAESLGVASASIESFDPRRVREAFGVPDDHAIVALIALGFAAESGPFPGRLGLDRVAFEEHFGQPWTLDEG